MFSSICSQSTLASSLSKAGALSILLSIFWAQSATAQLQHVEQLVFGMDCRPCAVGVQRRMERFEGVTSVELSLNRGMTTLELEDDNEVTIHAIRDSIRRGGFSPQHATVRVVGTLERDDDDNLLLTFGADERYKLAQVDDADEDAAEDEEQFDRWREAWYELNGIEPDQRVQITGRVPRSEATDDSEMLLLHVREMRVMPAGDEEGVMN